MTVEVKHTFQSAKGDGADTSLVKPSDWNAIHNFNITGPALVGKMSSGAGAVEEIPIGGGLAFSEGSLVATTRALPVGVMFPLAGNYEPPGWFICDGRAVSRVDYNVLFSITGDKFGVGDGVTTFNIPDMRGRVPAGKDNMGGTSANRLTVATFPTGPVDIGKTAGTERHILLAGEIPTHVHTLSTAPDHRHFVTTSVSDHSGSMTSTRHISRSANYGSDNSYNLSGVDMHDNPANTGPTGLDGGHTHTTTMSGTVDVPHLNLQPTMLFTFIVHHGVYA